MAACPSWERAGPDERKILLDYWVYDVLIMCTQHRGTRAEFPRVRDARYASTAVSRAVSGVSAGLLLHGMTVKELGEAAPQLVAPGAVLIGL